MISPTGAPGSKLLVETGTMLLSAVYATAGLPSASVHPILTVAIPALLLTYSPLINGPMTQPNEYQAER